MKHNMGNTDRLLRTIAAIAIGVLYFANAISGTTALTLGILAVILLFTSAVSFCPLYMPFRFSTRKAEKAA